MSDQDEFLIALTSRHGIASEVAELEAFAAEATKAGLHFLVDEASYDSNSCCCKFEFNCDLQVGDEDAQALLVIATNTIRQFEWFGAIHHGRMVEMPDGDGKDLG
jgi:hypothetical protein